MSAAVEELRVLFESAMQTGASFAFADRLVELWPELLAGWHAERRKEVREVPVDYLSEGIFPPVFLLECDGPSKFKSWLSLSMSAPEEKQTDYQEWEIVVRFEAMYQEFYAGCFGHGPLTMKVPDAWVAADYDRLVEYLDSLRVIPEGIDKQLP